MFKFQPNYNIFLNAMTLFYGRNSIKSFLKSSGILHFRDSKLKNFPYKVSHLQRSTRASKLQFQAPNKKQLPTALCQCFW